MNSKRLFWLLMAGLLLAVVALIGSVYGVSGLLRSKSVTLASNKSTVATLEAEQAGLVISRHDIAKYADLEAIAKNIVPQDKDQAEAVREITAIADANGVPLTTITFSSSTLGAGSAISATGAPAPAKPVSNAKAALSQLTPVPSIPGVYDLQITLGNNGNNTVSFNQLDAFLKGLENNRRTAEVSSLSIQPQASKPGQYIFTLVVNDYIKPAK